MNFEAQNYVKRHYDSHSNKFESHRDAKRSRMKGPAFQLKKFHNTIKRLLLRKYASGVDRLLDMCCGRGGDLSKWKDCRVKFVHGIDLSPGEIKEAKRRYADMHSKQGLVCEFNPSDSLGEHPLPPAKPFDVVTCMFALHYFFVSEKALQMFLSNVAKSLKTGGHFISTFPDGKQILACLANKSTLDMPQFKLAKKWSGSPKCFGSAFTFAITDTVTHGGEETQGSYEYLVFFNVLTQIAASFGLQAVATYEDDDLDACFKDEDYNSPYKHFKPQFDQTDESARPSLMTASACNVAVVFKKVDGKVEVRKPPRQAPSSSSRPPKPKPKPANDDEMPDYSW